MKVRCKRNESAKLLNGYLKSPNKAISMDNEKIQVACFTEDHAVEQNATCWTAGWGEQLDYATELHSISVQSKF